MATSTPARNLTILLTDIKGFTDKTSRKSRHDIMAMLETHNNIVLPTLQGRGGRLIKTIGDAFLMVFDSPTDAVLAGIAVQESLRAHNEGKEGDDRIEVRIAINSGEVSLTENDIFGEPVNITARIESVAEAGEVFFTEAVYLAMNKNEVPSSEVGLLQLKGIPEKIRVYKVRREHPVGSGTAAPSAPMASSKAKLVQPAGQAPAAPVARVPVALKRRAAALFIDVVLCGMLAGMLVGDKDQTINVRANPKGVVIEQGGEAVMRFDSKGAKMKDGKDVNLHISPTGLEFIEAGRSRKKDPFPLFWLAYCILFLKLWNTTPGGKIMKLKVVGCNCEVGAPLEWSHVLTRSLMTLISAAAGLLGFLWAFWDKEKKGWHDRLANTVVVDRDSC